MKFPNRYFFLGLFLGLAVFLPAHLLTRENSRLLRELEAEKVKNRPEVAPMFDACPPPVPAPENP